MSALEQIILEHPNLPVVLLSDKTEITSIVAIEGAPDTKVRGKTLFVLTNPDTQIETTSQPGSPSSFLRIIHSDAQDEHSNRCQLAHFSLEGILLVKVAGSTFHFQAKLTEMRFYNPDQPTPFDDSFENNVSETLTVDMPYPQRPPKVTIIPPRGLILPLNVLIRIDYALPGENLLNYLKQII